MTEDQEEKLRKALEAIQNLPAEEQKNIIRAAQGLRSLSDADLKDLEGRALQATCGPCDPCGPQGEIGIEGGMY